MEVLSPEPSAQSEPATESYMYNLQRGAARFAALLCTSNASIRNELIQSFTSEQRKKIGFF
jgi:hypothetical protein